MNVSSLVAGCRDDLRRLRRHFHTYPELSLQESGTIAAICAELDRFGIPHREIEKGGVIATVEGALPGKTLLLRADMDALPMQESECNLTGPRTCRSAVDGVMHACGHDGHTAILLVVARLLQQNRQQLKGRYLLVFERGEEEFDGIEALMQELDATEHYDGAWALHLMAGLDTGKVSVEAGPRMSGPFSFSYTIEGKSGHGSRPDLANNPLNTFLDFYQSVLLLKGQRANPYYPVTFSIGSIHAGTASNIVPPALTFSGTCRILDFDKVGAFWVTAIDAALRDACRRHGTTCRRHSYTPRDMAVVNNEVCAGIARGAAVKLFGEGSLACMEPWMASECFSMYLKRAPGLLAFVGTRNPQKGSGADHHNVQFDLDEDSLDIGACLTLQYALDFMDFDGDFRFTADPSPIGALLRGDKWLALLPD